MGKRIFSLFFNLGLHIGLHIEKTNTGAYSYLFGFRHLRSIFNPIMSLMAIRKIALVFLLSSKLNKCVLPVIRAVETHLFINGPFLGMDHINSNDNIDFFCAFALKFFRVYRISVLFNKVGLFGWWLMYYKTLKASIYGYSYDYRKKGFRQLFSLPSLFAKNKIFKQEKELKKFFFITNKKNLTNNIIALLTIFYFKLYDSVFGDVRILKFKIGKYIRKFKKFFAFLKLLLYLRKYIVFPNILFYLNPTNSELRDSNMFRICSISLVNSDNDISIPLYPVPVNNSSSLSKIFFCNLFVHFYYVGKILLILSVI